MRMTEKSRNVAKQKQEMRSTGNSCCAPVLACRLFAVPLIQWLRRTHVRNQLNTTLEMDQFFLSAPILRSPSIANNLIFNNSVRRFPAGVLFSNWHFVGICLMKRQFRFITIAVDEAVESSSVSTVESMKQDTEVPFQWWYELYFFLTVCRSTFG